MATHWQLTSVPPHDFFLCLDINEYFDFEHSPESIADKGFIRPLRVYDKEFVITIFFNGDPENPKFDITSTLDLSKDEIILANHQIDRILGLSLDLKPLLEQAKNDTVLEPLLMEFYGLKRVTRASLFEDLMNHIIQTQISHKPTARKMVYGVRSGYGTMLPFEDGVIASWPSPIQLMSAKPENLKKHGLSLRKGEYIVGLAQEVVSGKANQEELELAPPLEFYDALTKIRGVGPTTAQNIMLNRLRTDAFFVSNKEKGMERSLRRWIARSYGNDIDQTSESEFLNLIRHWRGFEAPALEYLYMNYVMREKRARATKKQASLQK